MISLYDYYSIPGESESLRHCLTELRTISGDRSFPIINGIPQFLANETRESAKEWERLERLNLCAQNEGWRQALVEFFGSTDKCRYVTDSSRAGFLDLLPLNKDACALEVGASLGQHTVHIARRVRSLHGLEVVPGQAEFAAIRCQQEGCSNVSIACGGDDCKLPYKNQSFDCVILNLVFEWCGCRSNDETLEASQRRLLLEIARVLKASGFLWLATKNRFSLRLIMGRPDEHVYGMRFGNALPRWLMYLGLKIKGRSGPEGLLYSHNSLKWLLQASGFETAQSFWAVPEMRYPKRFVSTDAREVRAARKKNRFPQGNGRLTRFLLMPLVPAGLVKHFTPGLAFLAFKGSSPVGE
jgi:SAM-dependent methyltransferase